MSPELYLGYILDPFTGMRKSAPLNTGTTYRSHSYSRTVCSDVSAPAIASIGISGMPSLLLSGTRYAICSFNFPTSSACFLYRKSLSSIIARNISQTPSDVMGKSGSLGTAIDGFERPFISPGVSTGPLPSNSHSVLKLNWSHKSASVSVPAFILPFRISENLEGFIPKLFAILVFVKPLSCNRVPIAYINRLFISVFSVIQKYFSEKVNFILNIYRYSVSLQRVPFGNAPKDTKNGRD